MSELKPCPLCGRRAAMASTGQLERERSYRASGWVSVDERLPERGAFVFVYCQPLSEEIEEYTMDMAYHDGKGWRMTAPDKLDPRWSWTHWLPIPSPPEAGQ